MTDFELHIVITRGVSVLLDVLLHSTLTDRWQPPA